MPQRLIYAGRPRGHIAQAKEHLFGDYKLTWRAAGNRYELYDLASDLKNAHLIGKSNDIEKHDKIRGNLCRNRPG